MERYILFELSFVIRWQGHRNSGRAGGAVKSWGQFKLIQPKKIVTNDACFCSTML